MMQTNDELARLRYQCRRGMLELDLVLMPFVEKYYAAFNDQEKQLFTRLLECHDYQLFDWLIKGEPPEDNAFLPMIERIRHDARL